MQFPGCGKDNRGRGGVAHIQVAGSILEAEVRGIEHIVACHHRALVRIPVHGVSVGVVSVQAQAAPPVAGDFEQERLIR